MGFCRVLWGLAGLGFSRVLPKAPKGVMGFLGEGLGFGG